MLAAPAALTALVQIAIRGRNLMLTLNFLLNQPRTGQLAESLEQEEKRVAVEDQPQPGPPISCRPDRKLPFDLP